MFSSAVKKRPRLSREEQREARLKQILEAAWAVYCERGYEETTMEAVAAHAGISRMPIYSLFGDKQMLYFELSRMFIDQVKNTFLAAMRPGVSLRRNFEQLARLAATRPEAGSGPGPESLFYVVQVIALSRPDIAERQRQGADEVIKDFATAIRASSLDAGDRLRASPEVIAAHIVAQFNGLSTVAFQTHHNFKASDMVAMFCGLAFKPRDA